MLEAARQAAESGIDVAAGYIEPSCPPGNHGIAERAGTAARIELPP